MLDKTREREASFRLEHDKMAAELQETRARMAALEQEVRQQREKDPVMTDTIQVSHELTDLKSYIL